MRLLRLASNRKLNPNSINLPHVKELNMANVGILTVHQSVNCGASLQAFALYKTISDLGHMPSIIDYRPSYFTSLVDEGNGKRRHTFKGLVKMALRGRVMKHTNEKFTEYADLYMPSKTKRYLDYSELIECPPCFEAYVCGSDQIWNPSHVRYDSAWVFGFLPESESRYRLISYAASLGKDALTERDGRWLKEGVSRFDDVSVREDCSVGDLESMGIQATQCLDPTLLVSADEWRSQMVKPDSLLAEKYIFYYPLESNPLESELLARLKKKTGLKCVALTDSLQRPKHADEVISGFGPEHFLYLIENAEVVFTNSFHGLVFSMIFGKPLVSFKNTTKNCRLESLLRLADIQNYQLTSIGGLQDWNIDHARLQMITAYERVQQKKEHSISFLRHALEAADEHRSENCH